jgi:hypothetical protein
MGEIGIIAFYGNRSIYPRVAAGVNINPPGLSLPPWQMKTVINGTGAPIAKEEWGDYITLRQYNNAPGLSWIGSAFVLQGGNLPNFVKPFLFIFDDHS